MPGGPARSPRLRFKDRVCAVLLGLPVAAVAGGGEGLAGAGGEGLRPAARTTAGADGGHGPVGGAPAQSLRHADPPGPARTEQ